MSEPSVIRPDMFAFLEGCKISSWPEPLVGKGTRNRADFDGCSMSIGRSESFSWENSDNQIGFRKNVQALSRVAVAVAADAFDEVLADNA